jgi:hypothetical protein
VQEEEVDHAVWSVVSFYYWREVHQEVDWQVY